jgi:hypothetical protein
VEVLAPMEPLTMKELVRQALPYRTYVLYWVLALPAVTFLLGHLLRPLSRRLSGWFLTLAILVAIVPGLMSGLTVGYLFLFTATNMVSEMDLVIHFGPIASMLATLVAATRVLPVREIPGLDRIGGMFLFGAVVSGILFALSRSRFATYFWLGESALLYIVLGLAALLGLGWWLMFGKGSRAGGDGD